MMTCDVKRGMTSMMTCATLRNAGNIAPVRVKTWHMMTQNMLMTRTPLILVIADGGWRVDRIIGMFLYRENAVMSSYSTDGFTQRLFQKWSLLFILVIRLQHLAYSGSAAVVSVC